MFLSLLLFLFTLIAILVAILVVPFLRRHLISRFVLKFYNKILPPISQTEREALDAGTVWWEGELFSGRPDWNKLLAYPKPELTPEEKAFI